MNRHVRWQALLWSSALLLALLAMVRADLTQLRWVSELSGQGSPPPARDAASPTGYALGQRQFLGVHERSETYRWIARTQEVQANGLFAPPTYQADNVPTGRVQLLPRLYAAWLSALAWGRSALTGEPSALAAEAIALWEPIIAHVLAFIAITAFMGRRHGAASAGLAGLFFAAFPLLGGQFIPGVLTPRTAAMLAAAGAIALQLPVDGRRRDGWTAHALAALGASVALWLDPAIGFPAVLISTAVAAAALLTRQTTASFLPWSLLGAAVTLLAWLVDRGPWNPAVSELRYVHPLYALAWLGLGLALEGCRQLCAPTPARKKILGAFAVAVVLVAPLATTQLRGRYDAWLHVSAGLRRLTSLDETTVFASGFDWLAHASFAEAAFVTAPALLALAALVVAFSRQAAARSALVPTAVLLATVLLFGVFEVRWLVVLALLAPALIASVVLPATVFAGRIWAALAGALLCGLLFWSRTPPPDLQPPSEARGLGPADLNTLVHRHFAHWLAAHNPGQPVAALASPELSDSLVFHGGCRVLLSTAWESYPGQVAASRILSALEASEAEAVLQSREITHVILPSWDPVLPLLVQKPQVEGKDTLYERLQRWVFPRYLRPIPYHLPAIPGYLDQKLAVFKVVPPQDDALALSRLAEYFVEMDRAEPAGLAAQVLAQSYPDDPNAAIARALVYAQAKNQADFARELARLAAEVAAGRTPFSWDRRVQRAIVFALGHRTDLVRPEIAACAAAATREDLFELTPLQAYRLQTLLKSLRLTLPDESLTSLLAALSEGLGAASKPGSR